MKWLSAEEQAVWRAYLSATKRLTETLDRELQRTSDIPHSYYEVLVWLSEAPDRTLRMSELADNSLSSRSRLSHAVARLEEKGWIRRETCPNDGRGANAVLTDAGFEALTAAAPGHVASVRRHLFDPLTAEQVRTLGEIATKLNEHLPEHG